MFVGTIGFSDSARRWSPRRHEIFEVQAISLVESDGARRPPLTRAYNRPYLPGKGGTRVLTNRPQKFVAVTFGANAIKRFRQQLHSHGFHHVRMEPTPRRA